MIVPVALCFSRTLRSVHHSEPLLSEPVRRSGKMWSLKRRLRTQSWCEIRLKELSLQLLTLFLLLYSYECVRFLCVRLVTILRAGLRYQGVQRRILSGGDVGSCPLTSTDKRLSVLDSSAYTKVFILSCTFCFVSAGLASTVRNDRLDRLHKMRLGSLAIGVISKLFPAGLVVHGSGMFTILS